MVGVFVSNTGIFAQKKMFWLEAQDILDFIKSGLGNEKPPGVSGRFFMGERSSNLY